jgi:hypothetical protein
MTKFSRKFAMPNSETFSLDESANQLQTKLTLFQDQAGVESRKSR